MNKLNITLIDVAWGDSIFVESVDSYGKSSYGLIDSNDTSNVKSTYIFLKRFFEAKQIDISQEKPIFDWIMLSHAHQDHGQGLKFIMQNFGTKNFYYPKSLTWKSLGTLISYATRSSNVGFHQSVDDSKVMRNLGNASIQILWPQYGQPLSTHNENNNSIVMVVKLGGHSILLTGDAEEDVWRIIANKIPANCEFFKVPHHGSINGTFDPHTGNSSYLDQLDLVNPNAVLGISSHLVPYGHPHSQVIQEFDNRGYSHLQTDENHHLTISTDGATITYKYSRI